LKFVIIPIVRRIELKNQLHRPTNKFDFIKLLKLEKKIVKDESKITVQFMEIIK